MAAWAPMTTASEPVHSCRAARKMHEISGAPTPVFDPARYTSHCAATTAGSGRCTAPRNATSSHVAIAGRSEEHTSELQSQSNLVCRLLLEKKKQIRTIQCLAYRALLQ